MEAFRIINRNIIKGNHCMITLDFNLHNWIKYINIMSDCMRPMPINNYIDNKSILSSRKNRTNQHTNKNNTKKQTGTNRNQK